VSLEAENKSANPSSERLAKTQTVETRTSFHSSPFSFSPLGFVRSEKRKGG
jgi:hypothetical protein